MLNKLFGSPLEDLLKTWRLPLALLLIGVVTVAVYWLMLGNGFIDYDDDAYVTANQMVRQGLTVNGVIWSLGAFHAGNWHPLTWLSHMLDMELFGLNPRGHHGVSLLLHLANTLLLCGILHRATGFLGRSCFVALLFAVHPLHVESVAWIAERKDLLSTLFWLLTMGAYAHYSRKRCLSRYLAVFLLLALGLMAKQMLVTLPLVLLLLDYWPLNRTAAGQEEGATKQIPLKLLLAEKIPFLLLSAAAALITLRAQESAGALAHGGGESILLYAGNALISYVRYLGEMVWPSGLAIFYPFEPTAVTPLRVTGAVAILAATTTFVLLRRKSRPYLLVGWFWYLLTLLPVIGFVKVGSQAMADRYTYIPFIGLFLIVAWGGGELSGRLRHGIRVAAGMAVVTITSLSLVTITQIRYWQNSYDLYTHALEVVERNWLAHNNLAILLAQQYRYDDAIRHFQESLRIYPEQADGFRNLGNVYQAAGRSQEAIEAFLDGVRINPNDVEGHFRLGYAYLLGGNGDLAYREYLALRPLNESSAQALLDSIRLSGKR